MIKSGITTGTPSRIPFGAGVYFKGVEYSEKVAPTEEQILAGIIGATQEGGTVTITPEFLNIELDGATVAVEELEQKVGETASIETSFAELTAENVRRMVVGAISESTDQNYDVITSSELKKDHYYEGFGFYGSLLDGRDFIIIFKKALCTSGFTSEGKNKTNSVFKGTFECRSDIEYGTTKLPYAIFIRKEGTMTPAEAGEVAEG